MRNGVGIAKSLHREAARFTQRAVAEFFNRQVIAFIIDAGTAMEHLAKAVVADNAPLHLFKKVDRDSFTPMECRVICGGSEAPPVWEELGPIVDRIAGLWMIGVDQAVHLASRKFVEGGVDRGAAKRVSTARNAAVHAGESPAYTTVDAIATDWLAVMRALGANQSPGELWGNWAPVATTEHLTTQRTSEADAQVRMRRAFNNISGLAIDNARRSWIKLDSSNETTRCPVCHSAAAVTALSPSRFPEHLQAATASEAESRVLDCLYCGLALYGTQIDYAQQSTHSGSMTSDQPGSEWLR
jgi:hypothetical protein